MVELGGGMFLSVVFSLLVLPVTTFVIVAVAIFDVAPVIGTRSG